MPNSKKTIGVIGGGNMGTAIISSLCEDYQVCVCESDAKKSKDLKRKYSVDICSLKDLIEDSKIIILAIKPQGFEDLLAIIAEENLKGKLFVSIAAGITCRYIEKRLGQDARVVRTMPNLPAQIGHGVTGLAGGALATDADVKAVAKILHSIGDTVIVEENQLDAVTAVSGSGPAYVFLFIESFLKSAKNLGLEDGVAKSLVMKTLTGSLALMEMNGEDADVLRKRVTSKGGTTAEALKVFEDYNYSRIFREALRAAKRRAKELSK